MLNSNVLFIKTLFLWFMLEKRENTGMKQRSTQDKRLWCAFLCPAPVPFTLPSHGSFPTRPASCVACGSCSLKRSILCSTAKVGKTVCIKSTHVLWWRRHSFLHKPDVPLTAVDATPLEMLLNKHGMKCDCLYNLKAAILNWPCNAFFNTFRKDCPTFVKAPFTY